MVKIGFEYEGWKVQDGWFRMESLKRKRGWKTECSGLKFRNEEKVKDGGFRVECLDRKRG